MIINRNLVKLNVGGIKYLTTENTLRSKGENFFTALLNNIMKENWKHITDEEGYIFIDRNGAAFEAVLEYLRTGKLFVPTGIQKEHIAEEFDYYSIAEPEELETEAFKLATHIKWRSMAQIFFKDYWSDIKSKMYEMVTDHGLNCCTLTLIHETSKEDHEIVMRFYNNIRVILDVQKFPPPLKPMFLDNIVYILMEHGFEGSYINRQQTVDIAIEWSQLKKNEEEE